MDEKNGWEQKRRRSIFPSQQQFATFFCRFCFISFAAFPSSASPTSFLPLFFAQVKSIISRTIKAKKGRKNHRVRIRDFRQGSGNPTVVRRHFFFLFSKTRKKKRSLTGFPHCFKGRKGNISFIFAETKKGFS